MFKLIKKAITKGKYLSGEAIHIFIEEDEDLFENLKYSSTNNLKLKRELEKFILQSIKKFPLKAEVVIIMHFCKNCHNNEKVAIPELINKHFYIMAINSQLNLKQKVSQWKVNMFVGLAFLISCVVIIGAFDKFKYIKLIELLQESLAILGWVAISEPLSFIFYGYNEIKYKINYLIKLSEIPVLVDYNT